MLVPVRTRALKMSSRLSFLKKDRQGVASTIGTIMALLVFLAFMALITNNYVPAWMLDNERSHMNQSIDQFGELKGKVDGMINQQRVTGDNSMKMYAPITMGAQGVPLFASPTIGLLNYVPQGSNMTGVHVQFSYVSTTSTIPVDVVGGGKVELYVPNRYYVQQWVGYENGAIIVKQEVGQTIRAYPNLDIAKEGNRINVAFTEVDLIGINQSRTGSDSVGFSLDLIYIDAQTYTAGGDLKWHLTVTTTYGEAWSSYFNETLAKAGLVPSTDYTLLTTALPNGTSIIDLSLNNCGQLTYNRAYVSMTLLTS
jgi:hypothetical protein